METIEQQTFRLAQSAFSVDEVGSFEDAVADPAFRLIVNLIRLAKAEERSACIADCENERVDAEYSQSESDFTYNQAIDHSVAAIRERGEKQNG